MKTAALSLLTLAVTLWAPGPLRAAGRTFEVSYPPSDSPGVLGLGATYTLWLPDGVARLRGVIVHQHGCGAGACRGGETAAHDLHWQALAKKWHCALLGPSYHQDDKQNCRLWCDPRNGSGKAFLNALRDLGKRSRHPELEQVPWCLWGHSGGGFWASLMQATHPERIVALWLRSGTAFAAWEKGDIERPKIPEEAYRIPLVCNPGAKEKDDKRFNGAWTGALAMFEAYRAKGAPACFAPDPRTGHECGDSRYLAIAFFDACLAQRLPEKGSKDQRLRDVDAKSAWLAEPLSDKAEPAASFTGKPERAVWLPGERVAKAWAQYVRTGEVDDDTPPPAPFAVKVVSKGDQGVEISWDAEADLESGLQAFLVRRDGKDLAQVPEKPVGRFGRPLFQTMSYHDTPEKPLPQMRYLDRTASPRERHAYEVVAINGVGLRSKPAAVVEPDLTVKAAESDPDFKVQGEYVGEVPGLGKQGVQVVALGGGKFDVWFLAGGLPGAGWDGKTRKRSSAATAEGKVSFSGKGSSGTIADGKLNGKTASGEDFTLQRTERHSPTLGAKPPEGAVVLFDGSSAVEWDNGRIVDGNLLYRGTSSRKGFATGKLHVEFRTSYQPKARGQGRGNSGVFVLGREIQVLDSFGLSGENNECGAFYSRAKPRVNMCLPPLAWQTYDVEVRPNEKGDLEATVWHNGVKVHEGHVIGRKGAKPASIQLQDHGNPVVYRNVWFVERPADEAKKAPSANVHLRGRLGNSRLRFETQKKGHVAFLGGSITEMNGYRPLVTYFLTKRFPDTKFTFTNAGISSTCSTTGAFRLATDVLAKGPVDLLLVEFAVNDDQDAGHARRECVRGMEGIVRRLRAHNPNADVVFVYFVNPAMLKTLQEGKEPLTVAAHEEVARRHDISSIHLAREVAERIAAGSLTWKRYGGTHPAEPGNQLAASLVAELLTEAWKAPIPAGDTPVPHPMVALPLDPNSYGTGRFLPLKSAARDEGWKLEAPDWKKLPGQCRARFRKVDLLTATEPGAGLTLAFEGSAVGAYVLAGPDSGTVEAAVDDGPFRQVDLFHAFSRDLHYPRTVLFDADLAPGKHTLRLRVAAKKNGDSRGHAVRIVQFVAN
jgi:lysophospholipase L1-like esterase